MSYYNQQQPPVGVPPPQGSSSFFFFSFIYFLKTIFKSLHVTLSCSIVSSRFFFTDFRFVMTIGYPPQGDAYGKDAYPPPGYPPQGYPQQPYPAQGYPPPYAPPQYAQPPPQQQHQSSGPGCLEGWCVFYLPNSL